MRPHIPEPPDPGARPQNRSLRPAARARRAPLVALAGALLLPLLSPIAPAAPSLPPELDPLVRNLDPGVRPGDDFFLYANGSWLRTHPIPASEQSWGIAKEVQEELYGQLRAICEAAAARTDAPRGSLEQKIGDFWAAGMDSTAIEQAGIEPLRPELDRIADKVARAVFRTDLAGAHRWGRALGRLDRDMPGLPDSAYSGSNAAMFVTNVRPSCAVHQLVGCGCTGTAPCARCSAHATCIGAASYGIAAGCSVEGAA